MKNSKNDKIQLITHKTLIIGVDIAKRVQWAQFTDYRGLEVSKHLKFNNDLTGFKSIIQKIEEIKKNTRRFSKRQLTWFKRTENAVWFDYLIDRKEIIDNW